LNLRVKTWAWAEWCTRRTTRSAESPVRGGQEVWC